MNTLDKAKQRTPQEIADAIYDSIEPDFSDLVPWAREALTQAILSGVSKGLSDLDSTDSALINETNSVAQDWAANRAAEMVGRKFDAEGNLIPNPDAKWQISETTRNDIRNIVEDAFKENTPLLDVIHRIQDAGSFSDTRAETIARQETSVAQTRGNWEVWEKSGLVELVTWLCSVDETVCDDCKQNDGVTVEMGEPFPSGDIMPGEPHPRCECSLVASKVKGIESDLEAVLFSQLKKAHSQAKLDALDKLESLSGKDDPELINLEAVFAGWVDRNQVGLGDDVLKSLRPTRIESCDFPIDKLIATQRTVKDWVVGEYIHADQPEPGEKRPWVVRKDGRYYLVNGTHRAVAALLRGESTVNAAYSDMDSSQPVAKAGGFVAIPEAGHDAASVPATTAEAPRQGWPEPQPIIYGDPTQARDVPEDEVKNALNRVPEERPQLAIDFDGTQQQPEDLDHPGPPMDGLREALADLSRDFDLVLFTARDDFSVPEAWLEEYDLAQYFVDITNIKPQGAEVFIDDKALTFDGVWDKPFVQRIRDFRTWWESAEKAHTERAYLSMQKGLSLQALVKFKYYAVLAPVPNDIVKEIEAMRKELPAEDVIKEPEPHITLLWGLRSADQVYEVRSILKESEPIIVTLGKTSIFPDSGDGEVLKITVESPGLHAVNSKLRELDHQASHAGFEPHITLAFMRVGTGAPYVGDARFEGKEFTIDTAHFSAPDKSKTEISLGKLAKYSEGKNILDNSI